MQNQLSKNPNPKYNIVSELQNYMLTKTVLDSHIKEGTSSNTPSKHDKPTPKPNNKMEPYFFPSEKDSLYWCFYIIKNGMVSYEINPNTFIKEKTDKINLITDIRNNTSKITKIYKSSHLIEIENDLANKEHITLITFVALCIVNNINFIYIHNRTYYELILNDSEIIFIIYKSDSRYGVDLSPSKEIIQQYRAQYFKIPNILKPLMSISSYKVGEIHDFIKQLQIQVNPDMKKPTKQYLFDLFKLSLNKN